MSPRAVERIAVARAALEHLASGGAALVLAATQEAADELVRAVALKRGALFALERLMLNRLVGLLAAEHAAVNGLGFLTRLNFVDGLRHADHIHVGFKIRELAVKFSRLYEHIEVLR